MQQELENELYDKAEFLLEYATHLMGCGVHTSRVWRNTRRIGEAYGYEVEIGVFNLNIILTLRDKEHHAQITEMAVVNHLPINFEHNARLSALSWNCYDHHYDFENLKRRYYKIISTPRMSKWKTLLMASAANASFCQLFGGDVVSVGIVFVATAVAFYLRSLMAGWHLNIYLQVLVAAFVSSIISSSSLLCESTSSIALATSVLFLVPGVPLINGVIDTIEGHVLTGITRLVNAILVIFSLSIGLGITLVITKGALVC
ncbi:MAG: threonine/serine exporter ThrE family protein [Mangrovibacterium sp.]